MATIRYSRSSSNVRNRCGVRGQSPRGWLRPGWVRGDQAMTQETRAEITELEAKNAKFEKKEIETNTAIATQIDDAFAHGTEDVELLLTHKGYSFVERIEEQGDLTYTWDEIIEVLGPFMIDEAPEPSLRHTLNKHMLSDIQNDADNWAKDLTNESVEISDKSWGSIIVQLRALRLITTGAISARSATKQSTGGSLKAGDDYLVALRAVASSNKWANSRRSLAGPPARPKPTDTIRSLRFSVREDTVRLCPRNELSASIAFAVKAVFGSDKALNSTISITAV